MKTETNEEWRNTTVGYERHKENEVAYFTAVCPHHNGKIEVLPPAPSIRKVKCPTCKGNFGLRAERKASA